MFAMILLTWTVFTYQLTVLQLQLHIFTHATLATAGISSCCVRLSQVGVLLKWLNVGSRKQHHTIAQGFWLSDAENLGKTQMGSPPTKAPNAGG